MSSMDISQTFAIEELREHNSAKDLWLAIHGVVYDVTKFMDEHPGGEDVLLDQADGDASEAFDSVGHSDEAREVMETLRVGTVKGRRVDMTTEMQPLNIKPSESLISARSEFLRVLGYITGLACGFAAIGFIFNLTVG